MFDRWYAEDLTEKLTCPHVHLGMGGAADGEANSKIEPAIWLLRMMVRTLALQRERTTVRSPSLDQSSCTVRWGTRGKKLVVLIGQRKALGMAVRNNRTENRFSGLLARLLTPG